MIGLLILIDDGLTNDIDDRRIGNHQPYLQYNLVSFTYSCTNTYLVYLFLIVTLICFPIYYSSAILLLFKREGARLQASG